jgi:hypothetical protein
MTRRPKLTLLAVGLTLLLVGCGLYYRTLNGQIFIVTKGSENVKLGLVNIYAYDAKSVKELLRSTLQPLTDYENSYDKKAADLQSTIKRLEPEIDAAQNELEKQKQAFDSIPIDSPQRDAASKALMNAEVAINILNESSSSAQLKKARDDFSQLQASGLSVSSIDSLGRDLSRAKASCLENEKSDADGHFTFTTLPPAETIFLIAYAERKTLDSTEYYIWVVPVQSGDKTVLLSNDNMISNVDELKSAYDKL